MDTINYYHYNYKNNYKNMITNYYCYYQYYYYYYYYYCYYYYMNNVQEIQSEMDATNKHRCFRMQTKSTGAGYLWKCVV